MVAKTPCTMHTARFHEHVVSAATIQESTMMNCSTVPKSSDSHGTAELLMELLLGPTA